MALMWLMVLVACGSPESPAEAGEAEATPVTEAPAPERQPDPVPPPEPGSATPTITALPLAETFDVTPTGLANGDFAPELALPDLVTGEDYRLSDHVGPTATSPAKVALVSFSASWCGPCKASLPHFKQLKDQHGDELEIIIVTTDKHKAGQDKELLFVRNAGLEGVPVLLGDEVHANAYMGQKRNIPHFYIINKSGEVLVQDRGYGKKVAAVLPKQLSYAFNHPEYVPR